MEVEVESEVESEEVEEVEGEVERGGVVLFVSPATLLEIAIVGGVSTVVGVAAVGACAHAVRRLRIQMRETVRDGDKTGTTVISPEAPVVV